jgi:hypothetical protein
MLSTSDALGLTNATLDLMQMRFKPLIWREIINIFTAAIAWSCGDGGVAASQAIGRYGRFVARAH